jgi:quercetin dioxygenase-like cupin family protein
MPNSVNRFMQAGDVHPERDPWATVEWLSRNDLVGAEQLLLVRATIEAGRSHPFHHHPNREEIIYVLSGRAEQWVGEEYRILAAGEMALIPQGAVHGTYNPFEEDVTFLAILAPADAPGPDIVDVSTEAPWTTMRKDRPPTK